MKVGVIDYGAGNLRSVLNALEIVKSPNCEISVVKNPEKLTNCDKIILPGVGAFGDCMNGLQKFGLVEELKKQVLQEKKLFLGICVGMQILAEVGFEDGEFLGLGFIEGRVQKIPQEIGLKVPQMGWNEVVILQENPILQGIENGDHVYFANSFYFLAKNQQDLVAKVDYGMEIPALLNKENIFGAQFHPEKSGEVGLKFLRNFLSF